MRKSITLLSLTAFAALVLAATPANSRHAKVALVPVDGSGVAGFVILEGLPRGGTVITVHATGLTPGTEYLSIYYENHTCELESDSVPNDVLGHYVASVDGTGNVNAKIDDDLDEINSISVRVASDLTLRACADSHPGG
jgi:hypothetical protein